MKQDRILKTAKEKERIDNSRVYERETIGKQRWMRQ
jgi:hypothetical protein